MTPEILDISETNFPNSWAEYHKNIYYLAYTSAAGGGSTNDRMLLLDVITNAYMIDTFSVNAFTTFSSGDDWDVLYSVSSSDSTVYAHSETVHGIVHKRDVDFTGTWDDMRYIPTRWGGVAKSPVLEIANITVINDLSGIINNLTGDINREDTTGEYTSQVLEIGAATFDKLYWHETIPGAGGNVLFSLRVGASSAACQGASWSSTFSDPTGSDISGITANTFIQYRIQLSTSDIDYTPTVYTTEGYAVKITFNTEGTSSEATIPLHWQGGWDDFGYPGYDKELTKIIVYHSYKENTAGTLNIKFTNFDGETDTFAIDMIENPETYTERFTNGKFLGELFKLDIQESSLNDIRVDKVIVYFNVNPML